MTIRATKAISSPKILESSTTTTTTIKQQHEIDGQQ
jgi:hypothetical protein